MITATGRRDPRRLSPNRRGPTPAAGRLRLDCNGSALLVRSVAELRDIVDYRRLCGCGRVSRPHRHPSGCRRTAAGSEGQDLAHGGLFNRTGTTAGEHGRREAISNSLSQCSDHPFVRLKTNLSAGRAHRSPTIKSEPGPEPLLRSNEKKRLVLVFLASLSLGPTNFAAMNAASVRLRAQSARRSAAVWILLVPSAMLSSRAISLFDIPWASSGRISFCRRVNRRDSRLKLTVCWGSGRLTSSSTNHRGT